MVPADNERRTRVSVLNINPDFHSSSLRRGAQVQQIDHSFGGPGVKALIAWNGVDNDQLCGLSPLRSVADRQRTAGYQARKQTAVRRDTAPIGQIVN
jgi:hypothetical protein